MKSIAVFLVGLFLAEAAGAQPRPLTAQNTPLPPGITVIPPASHKVVNRVAVPQFMTVTQHVIPRYVSGAPQPPDQPNKSVGPAGQLMGWGPMSVLCGNAQTQRQPVKAVVKTEDFGGLIAQWSSGEYGKKEYRPAVLRPAIRDCTIAGYDETRSNYASAGVVSNEPGKHNPVASFPDLYGGVFVQASGAHLENVTAFYIPGTAFWIARTGSTNAGAFGPWDSEKTQHSQLPGPSRVSWIRYPSGRRRRRRAARLRAARLRREIHRGRHAHRRRDPLLGRLAGAMRVVPGPSGALLGRTVSTSKIRRSEC